MLTEDEAIGAASARRSNGFERPGRTDERDISTADSSNDALEELGRGLRRPRNQRRVSWQLSGGDGSRGAAAATASPTSATSCDGPHKEAKNTSPAGRRCKKGTASAASATMCHSARTRTKKQAPKKVPGIFGIPVAWNVDDFDYDDSEDETYAPTLPSSSGSAGAPSTRCRLPRKTPPLI